MKKGGGSAVSGLDSLDREAGGRLTRKQASSVIALEIIFL